MSPFVTGSEVRGNNGWGPVLRRYFMSSKAAAILVDDKVPLWVSVNANQSQLLCLQARGNGFPYFNQGSNSAANKKNKSPVYSVLNYTICTATDLETLETSLADTTMWDGLKKDEMEVGLKDFNLASGTFLLYVCVVVTLLLCSVCLQRTNKKATNELV